MRKRILKYSIWIVVLLFGVGLYSLNADYLAYTSSLPELELLEAPEDTIPPRYPVAKTTPEEYQDIVKQSPADLRDPENVKTTIEYKDEYVYCPYEIRRYGDWYADEFNPSGIPRLFYATITSFLFPPKERGRIPKSYE